MHKREKEYFSGDAMAADAWRGKYALETEESPDAMHWRMAKEFARVEYNRVIYLRNTYVESNEIKHLSGYGEDSLLLNREGLPDNKLLEHLENKFYNYFKNFSSIIPQGSVMSMLGNTTKIGSLSNCFVIGQPYDSYGGIFQKDQECGQLMKRRGGVGLDISTLRPEETIVSNAAGTSTGAVSFAERYSNTTREVAQNGRRGALMLSIDIRHPDSLKFINMKKDRTKVTGANVSVMLRDDFMEAVKNDEDYLLQFPCDGSLEQITEINSLEYNKLTVIDYGEVNCGEIEGYCKKGYVKKIKAGEYYDAIVENAWENAEPGQIFINKHWDRSPDSVYPKYRGVTTNPCGEIFMGMYDACRLMALNFFNFVNNPFTQRAEIDYEKLYEAAYEQQRLADLLIDLELEHIERILNKIKSDPEPMTVKRTEIELWEKIYKVTKGSRRTGCGFTALGDMLAALNLKYDSDEAMAVTKKVMETKFRAELECTIDLAILHGTFEGWDKNKEYEFIDKNTLKGKNKFYEDLFKNYPELTLKMYKYGRRNISWSTVAPTGTVSLLAQTTSGLEPLFSPWYIRKKKINPGDEGVRVDSVDQNGDSWMHYPILHPKFKDWIAIQKGFNISGEYITVSEALTNIEININMLEAIFTQSPWYQSTANDIDWINRIRIQSIIQQYTTHSISSTINLPEDVTKGEVNEIYIAAYDHNLKGVTIYREGSRTGVLVKNEENDSEFSQHDAPKRPKSLPCKVHQSTSKGKEYLIILGLLKDKPYEVFCMSSNWKLPKGTLEGNLVKVNRSTYKLEIPEVLTIDNIALDMTDEEAAITRLVSTSLRHGADIKFVVEQLNKTLGDMQSFNKVLARTLKKYIPEGVETTGHTCDNCGADAIIYEEGCQKCKECGVSRC